MPITEILSEDQRRKRVWRRVHYLLVFSLSLVVAIALTIEFRSGNMNTYQRWIENYGEKLIDNYEPMLIQALETNNETAIALAIETLRLQPVVIEASLFDALGAPLSKQVEVPSAQLLNHYRSSSPQQFVRELLLSNKEDSSIEHLGFLRITLDRQFILKQNAEISDTKWHITLIVSLITLIAGIAIGKRFTKWRLKV